MLIKKVIYVIFSFTFLWLSVHKCKSPIKSTPDTNEWIASNTGLGNLYIQALAIDPFSTNILYASSLGGIFKSKNSGKSWTLTNVGMPTNDIRSLACHPQNRNLLYASTWGDGIFTSTNGGSNWQPINNGITDLRIRSIKIKADSSQHIFAGANTELLTSADGGTTWRAINKPPGKIQCLVTNFNSYTLFVGTDYNGIYRTRDEGVSWEAARSGLPYATEGYFYTIVEIMIDSGSFAALWAAINNKGVYYSNDNGEHWRPSNNGLLETSINGMAMAEKDPRLLLIGTARGVFMTEDRAQTWHQINRGLGNLDVRALVIDPEDTRVIYAGTLGGGIFKYVRN